MKQATDIIIESNNIPCVHQQFLKRYSSHNTESLLETLSYILKILAWILDNKWTCDSIWKTQQLPKKKQLTWCIQTYHWSNADTMCRYVEKVIVPYTKRVRDELDLPLRQKALCIFIIRPSSDGTYYGMVMSVRVSVRPSVTIFRTFLLHALTYWSEILCITLFLCT